MFLPQIPGRFSKPSGRFSKPSRSFPEVGRKESGSFREHSMNNETRVSAGSCSSPGVRGSFRKILRTFQESAEETFQLPEPSSCLWQAVRSCPGVTPQGGATMGAEWGRAEKVVGRSFYDGGILRSCALSDGAVRKAQARRHLIPGRLHLPETIFREPGCTFPTPYSGNTQPSAIVE